MRMRMYKSFSPIFPVVVLLGASAVSAETKFFYNQVGYDVGQPELLLGEIVLSSC